MVATLPHPQRTSHGTYSHQPSGHLVGPGGQVGPVGEWLPPEPLTAGEVDATAAFLLMLEGVMQRALQRYRHSLQEVQVAGYGQVNLEFTFQEGRVARVALAVHAGMKPQDQ